MTKTKWHSKLLSLTIAFAMVFSLVAMVVPVSTTEAQPVGLLSVNVTTEQTEYCCGDEFAVTANITNAQAGNATGVNATLTIISGDAELDEAAFQAVGNVTAGTSENATWAVHCTGDGTTIFSVNVTSNEQPGGVIATATVTQDDECGSLEVEMIYPEEIEEPIEISVCNNFTLVFKVKNTGPVTLHGLFVNVDLVGDNMERASDGSTGWTKLIGGSLAPGASTTGNYSTTIHCTGTGEGLVHIEPYGENNCGSEIVGTSEVVRVEQIFGVICDVTDTKVGHNATFSGTTTFATAPLTYNWTIWDSLLNVVDTINGTTSETTFSDQFPFTTGMDGDYRACVNVTDSSLVTVGCCHNFTVYPALNMTCDVSSNITKVGHSVNFTAERDGGLAPGVLGTNYTWSWVVTNSTSGTVATNTSANWTWSPSIAGNYTGTVTLEDNSDLSNNATCNKTVTVYPALEVSCNASTLETKVGHSVNFTAERIGGFPEPPANYTWLWDFGDGTGTSTSQNYTYTYTTSSGSGNWTASVTLWDNVPGFNNTATCNKTIKVWPALNVTCDVTPTAQTICENVTFTATRVDGVPGNSYNWFWEFSDNTTATTQNVTKTFMCVGNYTGKVTVTDMDLGNTANCTTEEVIVTIVPPELYTPINMAQLTSKNVAFTWEDIGCVDYILEVWQKDELEIKVWRIDTGPNAFWTGPVFNGNWKWQVTAVDACNNTANSTTSYFQVDQPGPSVMVNSPNGGEVWAAGEIYPITWFANPTDGIIDIDYSVDGGDTWVDQASGEANDGSYLWTLPSAESDLCLVRVNVNDYASGSASDTSDNVFTITAGAPTVHITNPTGGENWMGNSSYNITWTVSGTPVMVSLSYSSNGGATWTPIASSASLSSPYTWQLPSINSDQCLVKVEAKDALGNVGIDISGVFSIDSKYPDVNVKSPNGGEKLVAGTNVTITWSASDFWPMNGFGASQSADLAIDLYYSTDGGTTWETAIATDEGNDGAYLWSIPSSIDSTNCLVKVDATDLAGNVGSDTSNGGFSISPATDTTDPAVTVTDPDGAESYLGGDTQNITWTATDAVGVTSVDLYVSSNGGVDWAVVALGEDNDGTYAWTVPAINSVQCLVKAVAFDAAGNSASDMSNSVFTITTEAPDVNAPVVTVDRPVGGETFAGGSQEFILWSATDDRTAQSAITIALYYKVGTGNWTSITFDGENDGEFKWTVPVINSSQVLVKVEATDEASNVGFDVSDNEFTISTSVQVSIGDAIVAVNGTAIVPITISGVTDLAAVDIWLTYDTSVVIATNVTDGDMGVVVSNIDNTNEVTKLNWYKTTGMSGDLVFANIEFQAVGNAGDTSALELDVKEIADTDGNAVAHVVSDGGFSIIELMEGDVSLNRHVTIVDAMFIAQHLVAYRTLTPAQLKCADTFLDDGTVDIVDAMYIARWLVDPTTTLWDTVLDADMLPPEP